MCMIFRSTKEPIKQIGIWIGIVAFLPLTTWYGTGAFYPPPDAKEHYKALERVDEKRRGAEPAEKDKLQQEKDQLEQHYEDGNREFQRRLFWAAYPVGLVAVILGVLFRVQP